MIYLLRKGRHAAPQQKSNSAFLWNYKGFAETGNGVSYSAEGCKPTATPVAEFRVVNLLRKERHAAKQRKSNNAFLWNYEGFAETGNEVSYSAEGCKPTATPVVEFA